MKNKLILWGVLLAGGFLLGLVPQYMKTRQQGGELAGARQQLAGCQASAQLATLRDQAALMYLQANRMNYGSAADESRRFFDEAQRIAAETTDAGIKKALSDVLGKRDAITAALARGDAAVITDLQQLVEKLFSDTRR